jgi:hypothetical protein
MHRGTASAAGPNDASPTVDQARADAVSRRNLLHAGTRCHGRGHHPRSKRSIVSTTPISHDLDPWHRRAICGCHCGSLMLASQHATQQIRPWLSGQGGRRRRDTYKAMRDVALRLLLIDDLHDIKAWVASMLVELREIGSVTGVSLGCFATGDIG